nr:N-acetylmuramoyl-L-alanine amidase [uncultured Holophaga sp.]
MGGLSPRLTLATLLAGSVVMAAPADPKTQEIRASLPREGTALVRLIFRKGVQVERAPLPPSILAHRKGGAWASFNELTPEGKRWLLESLFPDDAWGADRVRHTVRWPELESFWLISALFTGHGQNYDLVQEANPGLPEKLRKGDGLEIPRKLLSVDLGGDREPHADRRSPEDALDDEAKVAAYRALLDFKEDREGKYALYRLRKGEALYSSVVMRYTDRVDPKEVNDLALELARLSGIQDVRAIQPGTVIRIPVKHLADPFQTEGSRALQEDREVRAEMKRTRRVDGGPSLQGVRIVLDPGHGGIDSGAVANGVWESDFVYDIAMRVMRILQRDTLATVSSTMRYPGVGFNCRDEIKSPTRQAEILTTPPFANDGESPNAVSVHLRWILANDWFADFRKHGDARKTVFLSFHADSLHPSALGTMAYVPGATAVPGSFTMQSSHGVQVAEMKRGGIFKATARERLQGEARSRQLAELLLKALESDHIAIHANRPIRNIIKRSGKPFVPAVIRHSSASAKVLLEVVNLTNEEDAGRFQDPRFRERYAEAIVKGIRAYFRL